MGVGGIPTGPFTHNAVLCEVGVLQARHERAPILHNAALCYLALPLSPLEGGMGVIASGMKAVGFAALMWLAVKTTGLGLRCWQAEHL